MRIKYFHNGKEVSKQEARQICLTGYWTKGYADMAEFNGVWLSAQNPNGEEQRDNLFDWSGYTLEIEV